MWVYSRQICTVWCTATESENLVIASICSKTDSMLFLVSLTQWLSEEMGMYADIGPGPKKHTWGAILLSKFPIINSTHHLLPSPHGELAPAIEAWLDIHGVEMQVIVSHNGQEEGEPLEQSECTIVRS